MSNEFLIDAVAQFLQGNDWQNSITQFLENNYTLFVPESTEDKLSKGVGYTFEQYAVFQKFTDMIERLLEGLISELGCNPNDLFDALQESSKNKSITGERRFFIKTLLAFEDYDAFHTRITQYAVEKQSCVVQIDDNTELTEWHLQLALAESLLDAYARGQLDETEQSYVPWAEALMQMAYGTNPCTYASDDTPNGCDVGGSANDVQEDNSQGLLGESNADIKTIEHNLFVERLKVDLVVAQRIADANFQLKTHMVNLSDNVENETETENYDNAEVDLEALFTKVDTLRERLKGVKCQCFAFKSVTSETMDILYLYLKEKIHYHQDLVSQERIIFDFISAHLDQNDTGLIPLLLEWLLLESEAISVQNQIQEALGQERPNAQSESQGYWTQTWDESSQAYFYYHSVSGESVWEPPVCGYYNINQDFQYPESIATEEETAELNREFSISSEAKENEDVHQLPDLKQTAFEIDAHLANTSVGQNLEQLLEMEQTLKRIAEEYDENRMRLELVLEVEKARQKEELRKHREKKRSAKKEKRKKCSDLEDCSGKNENRSDEDEAKQSVSEVVPPPSAPITQRPTATGLGADAKDSSDSAGLSIAVPGRGRVNLSHLLSDSHARRHLPPPPNAQMMLNPTSLKYLAEQLARKNPDNWTRAVVESRSRPSRSAQMVVELELEETEEK